MSDELKPCHELLPEALCKQLTAEYFRRTKHGSERQAVVLRELMQTVYSQGREAERRSPLPVQAGEGEAVQEHVMPPTRGTGSQQDIADAALCKHINALLALDADGALVPHGIGGHARELLTQASARLRARVKAGGQGGEDGE